MHANDDESIRRHPQYLDDFKAGDRISSGSFEVTAELIRSFAELYDPQPMHIDEEAAHQTIFGELVGSGWQTLAITMRLLVDAKLLGGNPIIGAEFANLRFHRPMRPGDSLKAIAEVLQTRPSRSRNDRGFMDLQVTTTNQHDETVLTQAWTLIVPTRTAVHD
ncbi:MaoC family dehydratase [Bosea sp. LjRoot237]|uniref:MaoC family dehydratase n=1 Tax=Bosea sp. LjRoot237 TaxID=3342292 RepID=UPI003ECC1F09